MSPVKLECLKSVEQKSSSGEVWVTISGNYYRGVNLLGCSGFALYEFLKYFILFFELSSGTSVFGLTTQVQY